MQDTLGAAFVAGHKQLFVALALYLTSVGTPGPSILAIMRTAMRHGRRAGFAWAAGTFSGSMVWAVTAGLGITALIATWAHALHAIKVVGGLYLLFLAWKSGRSAFAAKLAEATIADAPAPALPTLYARGLALHLTNPKAILVWTAIMSVSLSPHAGIGDVATIIIGCGCLAAFILSIYVMIFSTSTMVGTYQRARRWIEMLMASIFALAGLKLLLLH
ncbi:MAG: LysE family transporter [Hyphomicrobiales bacterium]|nr:LysE family transporter [Hyphomicrobiales bacterium]